MKLARNNKAFVEFCNTHIQVLSSDKPACWRTAYGQHASVVGSLTYTLRIKAGWDNMGNDPRRQIGLTWCVIHDRNLAAQLLLAVCHSLQVDWLVCIEYLLPFEVKSVYYCQYNFTKCWLLLNIFFPFVVSNILSNCYWIVILLNFFRGRREFLQHTIYYFLSFKSSKSS